MRSENVLTQPPGLGVADLLDPPLIVHVSHMVAAIGRLLRGGIKQTRSDPATRAAVSGAMLLPSPRRINALARVGPHFRNVVGAVAPLRHPALQRNQKNGEKYVGRTQHHPKPQIVVAIVGLIPVAIGAARVVMVVVPRAAANELSRLPGRVQAPGR